MVAVGYWSQRDDFGKPGGPKVEVLNESSKIIKGLVNSALQGDVVLVLATGQHMLELAEEIS